MTENTTQWAGANATLMTDRVASYAHDAIDLVATRLCGAEERARDAAAMSFAKLEARQAQVKQTADATFGRLATFAGAKPIATLGCAVAVGAVAARLLRRR